MKTMTLKPLAVLAILLAAFPAFASSDDAFLKSLMLGGERPAPKGYVIADDPHPAKPQDEVDWVTIPGGKFKMGTDSGLPLAFPVHEVTISSFQMSRTPVTVEQYAECVEHAKCAPPRTGQYCNWGQFGRERHPVNCVSWVNAIQYAAFMHARLPSEAEWEYAATSGGKNQKYPWGNEDADCTRTVMSDTGVSSGCGQNSTAPVCSKPKGNTAQGLCDMAGNVQQWMRDTFKPSYEGAPADGSAWKAPGLRCVLRGGSFDIADPKLLRSDARNADDFETRLASYGIRLAR